jgi:hypothetical protein
MAFKKMSGTEERMVGDVCGDALGRFREINGLLKWMLDCDPRSCCTSFQGLLFEEYAGK